MGVDNDEFGAVRTVVGLFCVFLSCIQKRHGFVYIILRVCGFCWIILLHNVIVSFVFFVCCRYRLELYLLYNFIQHISSIGLKAPHFYHMLMTQIVFFPLIVVVSSSNILRSHVRHVENALFWWHLTKSICSYHAYRFSY